VASSCSVSFLFAREIPDGVIAFTFQPFYQHRHVGQEKEDHLVANRRVCARATVVGCDPIKKV